MTNPVVFDFNFLIIKIIKIHGKIDPMDVMKKVAIGDKQFLAQIALFIARGIAILLSSVGIIDTIKIASHTQLEKLFCKKSINQSIL